MAKLLISEDTILERFRGLCLSLPETSETGSFGHPNFRAGKRTFAAFEWIKERPTLAFRLGADEVDRALLEGERFFATPYGRGLWASLWADRAIDWKLVENLIEQSYRQVALKRMLAGLDARSSQS
jgi:predicted DNA-binding protein (MmcQ/YjbR family)